MHQERDQLAAGLRMHQKIRSAFRPRQGCAAIVFGPERSAQPAKLVRRSPAGPERRSTGPDRHRHSVRPRRCRIRPVPAALRGDRTRPPALVREFRPASGPSLRAARAGRQPRAASRPTVHRTPAATSVCPPRPSPAAKRRHIRIAESDRPRRPSSPPSLPCRSPGHARFRLAAAAIPSLISVHQLATAVGPQELHFAGQVVRIVVGLGMDEQHLAVVGPMLQHRDERGVKCRRAADARDQIVSRGTGPSLSNSAEVAGTLRVP